MVAGPVAGSRAKPRGKWLIEVHRDMAAFLRGEVQSRSEGPNIATDEGLNRILDVMFHGTTQTGTWYCTIVETNTAPAAGMTYDVPVYTESTAYAEATRPAYVEAASSGKSMTNAASKAVFTINATKTLYGASLVSVNTKGDHTGGANNVLYCYALFAASQPVISGNVVSLTYVVSMADDGV